MKMDHIINIYCHKTSGSNHMHLDQEVHILVNVWLYTLFFQL